MRGIMFIEPLYRQTTAGLKWMTRRSSGLEPVNENPDGFTAKIIKDNNWSTVFDDWMAGRSFAPEAKFEFTPVDNENGKLVLKPHYKFGEVLYLKEPYFLDPGTTDIFYKFEVVFPTNHVQWKNKMFMAAEHGRTFVRITGIKCERLLDISSDDCIAEGIEQVSGDGFVGWKDYLTPGSFFKSAQHSFFSLYQFANKAKKGTNPKNIWVWAYTYEKLPYFSLSDYFNRHPDSNF